MEETKVTMIRFNGKKKGDGSYWQEQFILGINGVKEIKQEIFGGHLSFLVSISDKFIRVIEPNYVVYDTIF